MKTCFWDAEERFFCEVEIEHGPDGRLPDVVQLGALYYLRQEHGTYREVKPKILSFNAVKTLEQESF